MHIKRSDRSRIRFCVFVPDDEYPETDDLIEFAEDHNASLGNYIFRIQFGATGEQKEYPYIDLISFNQSRNLNH